MTSIATHPLINPAIGALKRKAFVTTPGYCQRFVRQVVQAVYGAQFDAYHADSAKSAARLWRDSPFVIEAARGSVPGDILYWEYDRGPFGHVAIRIPFNRVAENSIVHSNGVHGGKGIRPLSVLGKPSLIIRLPLVVVTSGHNEH